MMRTRLLMTLLTMVMVTAGFAQAATIPVSGDTNKLEITSESFTGLSFRVEVGEMQTLDVATKGGAYTRLLIPGFHTSKIEGSPELPMMNRLIAIPAGASPRLTVSNVRTRMVDLAAYGIDARIMPAQPSVSKSADVGSLPFVVDRAAYDVPVQPQLVNLVQQGRLRSMDIGRLEISPVTYYPSTGQLEVVESMDVNVSFDGADPIAAEDLIARTYSPFFEHLYADIAGARGFHDAYPDRVGDVVTMVIVTPPEFEAQLADFAQWKTERGFEVIMAVTGTPEVGTTTTSIQAYLHGLYNAATPEMPAPSFVLFVGDVAQMPTFFESGDATDRPYCAVDGDLVPDMYYGRFSATTPAQLQAQIDKSLMYDQFAMSDPSYLTDVTLIAGVDSGYAGTHGNGQINYGTEHYFNASHGITSNTWLYPASNGAGVAAAIVQTVDDGVSYINYTAHGSTTSWSNPSFTQSDINGLGNSGQYTFAVGNCCLTSTYDSGECFGETWLRAEDKGAIGYIGGSNSTYWDEDYWWGVGYHPSAEINGNAYPVEDTGIGVYDGIFHEHGEAMTQWYVTNDAYVFSGNLAVMESGSSRTTYYWNIYNLLGDPSLATYIAPIENTINHPETVFVGTPNLAMSADAGSYVGLTQDGVLVGAGTVDETGMISIEYLDLLTPGVPLHMVVTAQNRETYITDINVIVPATVTIDPMVIDVNVPTDITVTVMDADGVNPQPGINVWAEGLDYATAPVMTDANGVAVFSVTAAYGPTLDIAGQDPAEAYRLFTEAITVNAGTLASPDLAVTTDIGLFDAFALNLPGTLNATVVEPGHILYAQMPDGSLLQTTDASLVATPDQLGQVTGIIAVSGYDLYTEAFDVIEAYGTISGTVTTGGAPMAGVIVNCLDEFGGNVFSATTDGSGNYASPEEILVDDYDLVVDHFGYLHYEQTVFVNYGANVFDIDLTAAPSGVLTGTVMDSQTFDPLEATVKVYRTDTGDLYTETLCAPDGTFTTSSLPYFDYEVRVRAWHHVPVTTLVQINEPTVVKNFALDPTNGDLLLIDDSGSAAKPAKMGGKHGEIFLADAYTGNGEKSATQMAADIEMMGYYVSVVDAASVDPSTFWDYDLVILSCSDNTSTLQNTALKSGLVDFAQAGGQILLEGGELGYDQYGDADFANYVMHTDDWNHDSSGNVTVNDDTAYILNNPNPACTPLTLTYSGYGDSDAMAPLPDAEMPMNWSEYPTDASVITYDPNPAPEGGQIVFFCFNYLAVDQGRFALLENALLWLMTPEIGNCSISGAVMLAGMTDHSGVTVTASPNGGSVTTGADGSFSFPGLYAGTYTVRASKLTWTTVIEEVTLSDGQNLTGLNLVMNPTTEIEVCSQPGLPITDNAEISDMVNIETNGTVTGVEVYVNINHTWQGDLILTLTSPEGTDVVLHNRTGSSADDIIGWYPEELDPAESMDAFVGEEMFGDWTLTISDNAGGDQGTFNEWCLFVIYDAGPVANDPVEGSELSKIPSAFALHKNYPNPFNPQTNIKFDLPAATHVRLDIYDLHGRLVRTLVDEVRQASSYTVTWNGTNSRGARVASGVYYYRIQTDKNVTTQKMMLVK